jgi:dipeptidyl-peptidase-4
LKKYILLLLAGATLPAFTAFSQKKKLSLEESLTNPAFSMPIRQVHGFADQAYGEVVSTPSGDVFLKISKTKTDTLFFASAWMAGKRNFPALNWKEDGRVYALWGDQLSIFDFRTKRKDTLCFLPKDAENQDIEPKNLAVAYTIGNNLFVKNRLAAFTLTEEKDSNIVCGQSVHRNEYGITKGTFWSPEGNRLAYYRMDQRMVTDYPIVDISQKPARVKNVKYPMAGQVSHEVKIGVYDLRTKQNLFLNITGPEDQYLSGISWTPDEKFITVTILNRATNHLKLNVYDASTGNFVKTLLEEKSDKYLDPQEGPLFVNAALDFVWQSERNGFNHLYLFDFSGKLKKQLSQGDDEVSRVLGTDARGERIVYVQTGALGLDRMVKSAPLGSGKEKILSAVRGTHNPIWCDGKKQILDVWTNFSTPKTLDLIDLADGKVINLKSWAGKSPLNDYQAGSIDTLSIKGPGGEMLHARLIKPSNFDPKKKYPVIVYLYGGPHAQMVTNSWLAGASLYMLAWAEEGFIVFTIDNRGSDGRGRSFEQAHHRQLGTPEMEDQLAGVNYLKSLSYVDGTRLGIHGWSYGGFMTSTLMCRAPGTFKAGIAGAPVIDWSMYEIMYGERYMDTPAENPQGYELSNVANHAGNLKGKFMLIHGTSDDVVVWQHTQNFLKKAIEAGVPVEYFIYPGHGHGIGGKDRIHLMKKMTAYFKDHL